MRNQGDPKSEQNLDKSKFSQTNLLYVYKCFGDNEENTLWWKIYKAESRFEDLSIYLNELISIPEATAFILFDFMQMVYLTLFKFCN